MSDKTGSGHGNDNPPEHRPRARCLESEMFTFEEVVHFLRVPKWAIYKLASDEGRC